MRFIRYFLIIAWMVSFTPMNAAAGNGPTPLLENQSPFSCAIFLQLKPMPNNFQTTDTRRNLDAALAIVKDSITVKPLTDGVTVASTLKKLGYPGELSALTYMGDPLTRTLTYSQSSLRPSEVAMLPKMRAGLGDRLNKFISQPKPITSSQLHTALEASVEKALKRSSQLEEWRKNIERHGLPEEQGIVAAIQSAQALMKSSNDQIKNLSDLVQIYEILGFRFELLVRMFENVQTFKEGKISYREAANLSDFFGVLNDWPNKLTSNYQGAEAHWTTQSRDSRFRRAIFTGMHHDLASAYAYGPNFASAERNAEIGRESGYAAFLFVSEIATRAMVRDNPERLGSPRWDQPRPSYDYVANSLEWNLIYGLENYMDAMDWIDAQVKAAKIKP